MKQNFNSISFLKGTICLFALGAAFSLLPACSTLERHTKKADSSLPIEVVHSGTGKVASFRACETSESLFVAGSTKGRFIGSSAHVDVQLLDGIGRIIAQKVDSIDRAHPRTSRGRHGQDSFVASFPLAEARQAARIRVIYHNGSHSTSISF